MVLGCLSLGGFIGDCAFVSRLSLRICVAWCLGVAREPLGAGLRPVGWFYFGRTCKNSKEGFSIAQCKFAGFAATSFPSKSQTNDRGVFTCVITISVSCADLSSKEKEASVRVLSVSKHIETRCPRSGETHPVLVKEID